MRNTGEKELISSNSIIQMVRVLYSRVSSNSIINIGSGSDEKRKKIKG
jgi:hypothetical protein